VARLDDAAMSSSLVPDRRLRTERDGKLLLGGHPFRVMTLSPTGASSVRSWFAGRKPSGSAETDLAMRLVESGMAHPHVEPTAVNFHVVIPFRGRMDELQATLSDLDVASITVVDDGSDPPLPPIDGVEILRHAASRGPAAARNTGWRHVVERVPDPDDIVILFLDGDVRVTAGALELLAGHFHDATVAAAAPRVMSTTGSSTLARYEMLFSPLDLGADPSLVGSNRLITYVPSACLAVRASALIEYDGFDEYFRYGEDVDFVWRVAGNHQVRYEPRAVVHHHPRASIGAFAEQRFRYATAAAPLASKHPASSAPWQPSVVGAAGIGASLLGHSAIGAAIGFLPVRSVSERLGGTATPVPTAIRLLALGHGWAARSFAENTGRSWFVVSAVMLAKPSFRRRVLGWLLAGWLRRITATRSPALVALGVLDDVAYGVGTAAGAWRERSLRAIRPRINSWK
jgi:mycofactocin system glycosyltransferase